MRRLGDLVLWAIFGAVLTALAMFIYQAFVLIRSDVQRDDLPVARLLLDVMHLDRFALYGALGGLVLGVGVVALAALGSASSARRRAAAADDAQHDPDMIIKMRRASRADAYLASRRGGDDAASRDEAG